MFKIKNLVIISIISMFCFGCASTKADVGLTNAEAAEIARQAADRAFSNGNDYDASEQTKQNSSSKKSQQDDYEAISEDELKEAKENSAINEKDDKEEIASKDDASINKSKNEPSWVKYPQEGADSHFYLCATGAGKSTKEAGENATAALARIIRQDIKSKTITTDFASNTNGEIYSSSSLDEIIETDSMIKNLVGVKIQEYWISKTGLIHALVVLNRHEASMYYTKKIADNNSMVMAYLADADKSIGSFESFFAITKAAALAKETNSFMDILFAVDPLTYRTIDFPYGSIQEIEKKSKDVAANISVGILVEGDLNGRVAAAFAKVFTENGLLTTNNPKNKYIFETKLALDVSPLGKNIFVRYTIDSSIKDTSNGKIWFPYSANGREGHLTEIEATNRAVKALEKHIDTKFAEAFQNFLLTN